MHFHIKEHNSNRKRLIFHSKAYGTQFDLAINRSRSLQGLIYINFIELSPLMLHTKFQGNWPNGYGVEHFLRFLPYIGMASILVM